MRAVLIATMAGTLLLLSGCGQKGPLYIPQQAIPQDSQPSKSSEDRSATTQTSLDDSN
jgi:predicted small lipoprotein YifL